MSDNELKTPSPDEEIEMLFPWYATGQISEDDRVRVERYLDEHPEARGQLALVREEMEATDAMAEALGTPRAGALGRLLAEIEAGSGEKRRFGAGDIMLADDTTGQGHITRDLEGPRRSLFILVPADLDVSGWKV